MLLVATDEKQRNILLNDLDMYVEFIEQISFFIGAKAAEYKEMLTKNNSINTLTSIMNYIEQGVLVLDQSGIIKIINDEALKQLKVSNDIVGKRLLINATGDYLNDLYEYKIKIDHREYVVLGNIYNLDIVDLDFSRVLIFKEKEVIYENLYKMISTMDSVHIDNIVGTSPQTIELKKRILKIAKSPSTVLITGESGTGKELIAKAIWKASDRRNKKFVPVNCSAIPETLIESELFGYVKGAFTGATTGRIGKFEIADGGILFLDEIGDIPLHLQPKLLRVLQEKEITRIGSNKTIPINTRIIAATNKDLKQMIAENKFREDLYYRLNVIPTETTPLRDRTQDIKDLFYFFLERYLHVFGKQFKKIHHDVMVFLQSYSWPGNVRELENTVEYIVNMLDDSGIITMDMLPWHFIEKENEHPNADYSINTLEAVERKEIEKAIHRYGNDTQGKKLAAKKLGISLSTLYRKLEYYGFLK